MAFNFTEHPVQLDRRCMLLSAAATVALPTVSGTLTSAGNTRRVDTHLHCFAGPDDSRFPYHDRGPYRPVVSATPEHLLKCMDDGGVDFAVVVHPEPYQDDHRYLEHCLAAGNGRLKGTCLFFADHPMSIKRMRQLAARVPIIAARVHAYVFDRLPPFGKPELEQLWRAAGECGLAVQLHFEPRYAPGFEPLIRKYPDIQVIVDHLGRPFQGTREEHEVVIRWSRFPNTIMKLSSIPSQLNYPHRDPAPVIHRLCDEYGPDRMLYGGGFRADATGDSYRASFERARGFLSHWSEGDQAKVLGENAVRLFRFTV
jgi:predicted TIM-barrel fold metal-dependent hydrolase